MTQEMRHSTCDKCRQPVPLENDATLFDAMVNNSPYTVLFAQPRHLLPVLDEAVGKVECPGSPSRAQYIPGQPLDPRYPRDLEDPKDVETAKRYQAAYEAINTVAQPRTRRGDHLRAEDLDKVEAIYRRLAGRLAR